MLICKNPYCKSPNFAPVIEMDNNKLIGIKCMNCQARYDTNQIEILKSLKRTGWNSPKFITDDYLRNKETKK